MNPDKWSTDSVVIAGTVLLGAPIVLGGVWYAFVWLMAR